MTSDEFGEAVRTRALIRHSSLVTRHSSLVTSLFGVRIESCEARLPDATNLADLSWY